MGTYAVLTAWLGVIAAAIATGVFEVGGDLPVALLIAVGGPPALVAAGYRWSPLFREYLLALDLRVLLAAQLWRVVGASFLFAYAFDRLPADVAISDGVGDIATGLAALPVIIALSDGTLTRRWLYAFTALGVADFVGALITGLIISRPVELELWPLVIFPVVMVPFFSVLHLIPVLQSLNGWEARVAPRTTAISKGE